MIKARVNSDCSSVINMRRLPDVNSEIEDRILVGTIVDVNIRDKEWSNITVNDKTGYMMNIFLVFGEDYE